MVTKAKDVPWNEVEDMIDLFHQWLVERAGGFEFDDGGSTPRKSQRVDALVDQELSNGPAAARLEIARVHDERTSLTLDTRA